MPSNTTPTGSAAVVIAASMPSGVIRHEAVIRGVDPSNPVEFLKKSTLNLLKRLSAAT